MVVALSALGGGAIAPTRASANPVYWSPDRVGRYQTGCYPNVLARDRGYQCQYCVPNVTAVGGRVIRNEAECALLEREGYREICNEHRPVYCRTPRRSKPERDPKRLSAVTQTQCGTMGPGQPAQAAVAVFSALIAMFGVYRRGRRTDL